MPLTPLHFGPSTLIALPLKRYLDLPVFVLANVIVDLEPLAVIVCELNYPQHGYLHTLLIGGVLGIVWGIVVYPFRSLLQKIMNLFKLDYSTNLPKMLLSGALGIMFHVVLDAFLYYDVRPFYPYKGNPLLGMVSQASMNRLCVICFVPTVIVFVFMAHSFEKREQTMSDNNG